MRARKYRASTAHRPSPASAQGAAGRSPRGRKMDLEGMDRAARRTSPEQAHPKRQQGQHESHRREREGTGVDRAIGAQVQIGEMPRLPGRRAGARTRHAQTGWGRPGGVPGRQRAADPRRQTRQQDRTTGEPAGQAPPPHAPRRKAAQGARNAPLAAKQETGKQEDQGISPATPGRCGTSAARAKRPGWRRRDPPDTKTSAACAQCAPGAAS